MAGAQIFLVTATSRLALGPTQPPIKWVLGALFWIERDHSPPPSAKVKNAWNYTSTLQYVFMACCLIKH
jgi:hypothetical protein